jgi:uncharacterized phage protein (TIGR01671 family)
LKEGALKMRKIRFRAWDIKRKGFINGFNMIGFGTGQGSPDEKLQRFSDYWNEGDFILQQFTGLYDAVGKPIFEGDIWQHGKDGSKRVWVWKEEYAGFVPACRGSFIVSITYEFAKQGVVIGNIYQNPELNPL